MDRIEHFSDESDWIVARSRSIGCSDLPGLFGHGYAGQTPLSIYRSKVDTSVPFNVTRRMRAGVALESLVVDLFTESTGWYVHRPEGCKWVMRHKSARLSWSPDGIVDCDSVAIPLECKAVVDRETARTWRERVPDRTWIQMQGALAVSGAPFAYGAAILGGDPDDFHFHKVERDEPWISAIVARAEEFMCDVDLGITPEPTAHDGDTLKAMYPTAVPGLVRDVPAELLERYEACKQAADAAIEQADALKNAIIAIMGEAEIGNAGDRQITYKTQNRKAYEVKASSFRKLWISKGEKNDE